MDVSLKNNLRRWLANKLARLARRIYPESEEVLSFWADRMIELVITGQTTIKVESVPFDDIAGYHAYNSELWKP